MQFPWLQHAAFSTAAPPNDPSASHKRPTRTELLSAIEAVIKKNALDGKEADLEKSPKDLSLEETFWKQRLTNQIKQALDSDESLGWALKRFQITAEFLEKSYSQPLKVTARAIRDDVESKLPPEQPVSV
jgi:hypothetical protein